MGISTCPLSTSLGRFDWRWRLLLTSGIIWLPEYFREAAPSRRLTKIQISLLQLRLPSDPRRSFLAAARHAFSERGIQNNRAEGRGDHTRSTGDVHARRLRSPRRSLPPLLCLNPPPSPVTSVCVCLLGDHLASGILPRSCPQQAFDQNPENQ